MSRSLWWRFLAVSILFAVGLTAMYLFMLREVTGKSGDEVQRSVYVFIARIVEESSYEEGMKKLQSYRAESPAIPLELWVVDGNNSVLARNTDAAPPVTLLQRDKPEQIHDVVARGRFFSGSAASAIVRLRAAQPVYLLVRNPGTPAKGTFLTMTWLFLLTVVAAILLGLFMLTFYLRGRSQEAQKVIQSMEAGNLSTRFATGRLDAIGGLMVHFNSMADEIERLVTRLQANERLRREMLQELGHDLRTPLTSMRAAVDTLATHGEAMTEAEREEFFAVINSEIVYFTKLIDDLFFIASIDEPRYRKQLNSLNLLELLRTECANTQNSCNQQGDAISFVIEDDVDHQVVNEAAHETVIMQGDAFLISRLFRNVFDNAIRHARQAIRVRVSSGDGAVILVIEDDGAGMSPAALHSYGQRREQRLFNAIEPGNNKNLSLGLGSVIIKTIVELHGGQMLVENGDAASTYPGTRLQITFPTA
ncbi:HAMP domain-containing sensor histidine kinase [Undibacterium sp. TS12]|uniref:HAMP domain-containing sensor histidine kinase n=1 Tax=Undibacterium sp. TS12 TaxID=2908202 RepID=UPI001F4CEC0E|nr:HAMP domain-containing sensor histidine kinase [Undibacterium sp. TS12]MCH8622438.1 HAMP domain-containing histidine kinase [Undibacterium sp. TS12]